jgi:aspartate/methionine/tyrosine aminotransferase
MSDALDGLISSRARAINGSGIRQVLEIGARVPDKVDLSIGQPDFPVPEPIQAAAIEAIRTNRNGYPPSRGIPLLMDRLATHVRSDLGWACAPLPNAGDDTGLMVTSGTSGGLMLAALALLNEGDEIIIPDPWFVLYPYLATLTGAKAVKCDTYPDFKLTAERVAPLITPRTKAILLCSPGNPSGVVATERECADLLALCQARNIVLISDEIYDEFAYSETRTQPRADGSKKVCPSPARLPGAAERVLVIRGFGKTYGVTGWRLGYATGPKRLIDEMAKLQQYVYVGVPHPLQVGAAAALDVDMTPHVAEYERRRDLVVRRLREVTEVQTPGGAFYAFAQVPARLGTDEGRNPARTLFHRALDQKVLIVPGDTFSARGTHFRLSFATEASKLERGLDALVKLMKA